MFTKPVIRTVVIASLSILFVLLTNSCGDTSHSNSPLQTPISNSSPSLVSSNTPTAQALRVTHLDGSWPVYKDLATLKRDANVVIAGTVIKTGNSFKDASGIAYTNYTFKVGEVVWDPNQLVQNSTSVVIRQLGGIIDNNVYEVHDFPAFKIGENAILFLHMINTSESYVLGPTGRFTIQNGSIVPPAGNGLKFSNPKSQEQFVAEIKATSVALEVASAKATTKLSDVVVVGQPINLVQFYGLDKTQSIIIKGGSIQGPITDLNRIKSIISILNKPTIILPNPSQRAELQTTDGVHIVFSLANGKWIGLEYNRKLGTLTTLTTVDTPDLIMVSTTLELNKALGLN